MEKILNEIMDYCSNIEALAVVDEEGLVISQLTRESSNLDVEEIASLIMTPALRLKEAVSDVSSDERLEEINIFLTNTIVYVYSLALDTYLVAVVKRTPLYGKARFAIRRKLPELRQTL